MITLMLKGGLGNQMFQYAAARNWARINKIELALDTTNYDPQENYRLHFFNITSVDPRPSDVERLTKKGIRYKLERIFLPRHSRSFIWEKNWVFDQKLVNLKTKDAYIRGLFLSPKYFTGSEDIIRREFTLKQPAGKQYSDMAKEMIANNSVALHIRRGDFLLPETRKIHAECGLNYYKQAADIMASKIVSPHFFVFSDDIEWAKQNLNLPFPMTFVSDRGFTDYEEMMLIATCKHAIIADSTFSWWGAWLNQNRQKIIIAPKKWLVDEARNEFYTKHLIPTDWITL